MRRIDHLSCAPIQRFDDIVATKQSQANGILRALRERVEHQYSLYQQQAPQLDELCAIAVEDHERRALLSCYTVGTQARNRLVGEIKGKHVHCPYCDIGEPSTIEHYLPKEQFPELSVCHLNMLPCCADCNTKKGKAWRNVDGRRYLHLYFDPIDGERAYLTADVTLHGDLPRIVYRVDLPPGGNRSFYALYRRHCQGLGLLEQFARRAEAELVKIREDVGAWASEPARVEGALAGMYEQRRGRLGSNHWEVALLHAIAASPALIAWCCGTMDTPGQGAPS